MKKIFKFCLLLVVTLFITGCSNTYLKEINYNDYKQLIANKESFILEVMSTDCPACENFKPKLKSVLEQYGIEAKYIDTSKLSEEEYSEFYKKTGIGGTPTIIFYVEGVEETKSSRINGSVSTDKIISKFKANGIIE